MRDEESGEETDSGKSFGNKTGNPLSDLKSKPRVASPSGRQVSYFYFSAIVFLIFVYFLNKKFIYRL